jgi:predicted nucleic acid-binding protein
MPKIIISDTSCLILLTKINELEILQKIYSKITITPEIFTEFGESLPSWIEIIPVKDAEKISLLELQIDKGESSAIALALEYPGSLLIMDDYKARLIAAQLHIKYTGTFGVILKAKKIGKIENIKPIISKLKETDFYISDELEKEILRLAEE